MPDIGAQTFTDLRSHDFGIPRVVGYGEDTLNRVYIVSLTGTVHRLDPASYPPGAASRRGDPPIGDGEGTVNPVQVGGSFDAPVNSAFAPGEESNVYVVEQDGTADVVSGGSTQPDPFLDITDLTDNSGEQGFLSMAFHPDFATNGLVYAYYTDEDTGDIVVSEFETNSPLDADEASGREVIRIKHRFASNHNGGHITFGPDGFLYISTGDGGDANDPKENGQDKDSLLGKLLRIDPLESGGDPYTVPESNPFVGKGGADEVYAFGLRNPFRMNFDPETEWLAIGDVGQDKFEEVDMESADTLRGANFGWDRYEGFKKVKTGGTAEEAVEEEALEADPRLRPRRGRVGHRRRRGPRPGSREPLRALPLHRLLREPPAELRAEPRQGEGLRRARQRRGLDLIVLAGSRHARGLHDITRRRRALPARAAAP